MNVITLAKVDSIENTNTEGPFSAEHFSSQHIGTGQRVLCHIAWCDGTPSCFKYNGL